MSIKKLYFADLTHTGQSVASNVFPLAVGLIANYILRNRPNEYDIELFKYPDDLSAALKREPAALVGFSNYSWNCDISYQFTKRIKTFSPNTVVIWGGPNYGLTKEELHDFWVTYPLIDFYLIKEGEKATLELLDQLQANGFDVAKLKASNRNLANAHYLLDSEPFSNGEILPRIKDLEDIGSPYLTGLMDKFFDDVLIPMIHTTRGCPFSCTFCSEGNSYYNKVAKVQNLRDELVYIANRRKGVQDLLITDANFGMFPEDTEKAQVIAEIKSEYGWPNKILVSTGKNKKERVIEVASKLDGALSIAASLQSTDQKILKTIKRSNISTEALNTIVAESKEANSPTYTEIILGLPGDCIATHLQTLQDVIDSGLGIVRMYQLIMLPQTELATPDSRREHQMKTVFRINPRSFGRYRSYGEDFASVEHEEICYSTSTLSREDYLFCRQFNLSVEVLHNTSLFVELRGLLRRFDIKWFDFINAVHHRIQSSSGHLKAIYNDFVVDCFANTFESRSALVAYFAEHHERIIGNPAGTNEMVKAKARAVFQSTTELHDIAYEAAESLLEKVSTLDIVMKLYLSELKQLSLARKSNLDQRNLQLANTFNFDFSQIHKHNYEGDPKDYYERRGISFSLGYSDSERQYVEAYFRQYGSNIEGLGRILMRINVAKLFRPIRRTSDTCEKAAEVA